MCRADKSFDPFAESTVDGIIAGAVTVKVYQIETVLEVQKLYLLGQPFTMMISLFTQETTEIKKLKFFII